jgi:hypothetical protein
MYPDTFEFLLVANLENAHSPVGTLTVYYNEFEEHILIHDVWNLKPETYRGVGTLIMHEAIDSLIKHPKQYHTNDPHAAKWIKLSKGHVVVESVFEAMLFYDKLGFELKHPDEQMISHPLVPLFIDDLKEIETLCHDPVKLGQDKYMHYYKTALEKAGVPVPAHGIASRFSAGTPTHNDWVHYQEYVNFNSDQSLTSVIYDHKMDYYQFKKEFPNVKDYMDYNAFMKPAKVVLEHERQRIKSGHKPRVGMHNSVTMVLNMAKYKGSKLV